MILFNTRNRFAYLVSIDLSLIPLLLKMVENDGVDAISRVKLSKEEKVGSIEHVLKTTPISRRVTTEVYFSNHSCCKICDGGVHSMKDENARYIAVFLIAAKDRRKEFFERAQVLIDRGEITRDDIPKLLDKICKMKGNTGEIGREIRDKLKREGWSP